MDVGKGVEDVMWQQGKSMFHLLQAGGDAVSSEGDLKNCKPQYRIMRCEFGCVKGRYREVGD